MSRFRLNEYHRPFLFIESFVPNDFVAVCENSEDNLYSSGVFCFDLDDDKEYDTSPNEQSNLGGEYLGGHYLTDFKKGHFKILNKGRYLYEGGKTYLYLGTQPFNDNGTYSYTSNLFAPLYYAELRFKEHYAPGEVHDVIVYFTNPNDVINAS